MDEFLTGIAALDQRTAVYRDLAQSLAAMRDAYLAVGFTREESFAMVRDYLVLLHRGALLRRGGSTESTE